MARGGGVTAGGNAITAFPRRSHEMLRSGEVCCVACLCHAFLCAKLGRRERVGDLPLTPSPSQMKTQASRDLRQRRPNGGRRVSFARAPVGPSRHYARSTDDCPHRRNRQKNPTRSTTDRQRSWPPRSAPSLPRVCVYVWRWTFESWLDEKCCLHRLYRVFRLSVGHQANLSSTSLTGRSLVAAALDRWPVAPAEAGDNFRRQAEGRR
jgi:hypothetical protein